MKVRIKTIITGIAAAASILAGIPAMATPALAAGGVPRPSHIVIVVEENQPASAIYGSSQAPYINSLAQGGAQMTQSYGITHPSEPNYLALFSGSTQGVTGDPCPNSFSGENLGSELIGAGLTFGGYSESLPSVGYTGCYADNNNYQRPRNPWVDFSNVPAADNMPFTSFPADYNKLPTVSIVTANICNSMHSCSISTGDSWLQNNLGAYATWAKANNSLLVVTYDEDDFSPVNQIPTVFYGAGVKPGAYPETVNHYNLLRTVEDAYGLTHAGNAATAAPITDIWSGGTVSVTTPANQSSTVNTAAGLQIQATDSGGQALTYTATGLPAGLGINAATGLVSGTPTTTGSSTVTVTATDTAGATGSATFSWTVNPVSNNAGIWETYLSGNLAMDDPASSTTPGTQLIAWGLSGSDNQRWTYYRNTDGTYVIKNLVSGLCVDDSGGSLSAGSPVIQWTCNGQANQNWSVFASGTGSVIVNKLSGLAITSSGTTNGSTLTQQPNTGSALQTWSYTKVG